MTTLLTLALAALASAAPPVEGASKSAQAHFLKGSLLERRGAYVEALAEYERAFSFDPASAYICQQAARLALELGNHDAASAWVKRLEPLAPADPQTKVLLGRSEWARGRVAEAQAAFEAALKLNPKSAESIFSLGNLLSAGSPEKARQLFLKFLEQNPEQAAEAHHQLGLLEQRAGKTKEAQKRFRAAVAADPDDPAPRWALAQLFEVARDTPAALVEYLGVLKIEPQNVELLNHVGEIHHLLGQNDQAREKFETAKGLSPGDPVSSLWLAMLAEQNGDYAAAARNLADSRALKEDPWLNLRLSYFLTQGGKLKEAVAVLEEAHRRWPSNDEIAYYLALGYDDLKRGKDAMALLRKVLALKPDYRDARYQLAVLLERAGDINAAEGEFRNLLAAKPDDPHLLNYLGYSLADRGLKLGDAEVLILKAVRLDPKSGAYQDSLGWLYHKQGRSTDAVRELEGAVRKLAEDATIWDHLGDAYAKTGDEAGAWRSWRRAQALDIKNVKAAKKAAQLQDDIDPRDLGGIYLDHLAGVHSGLKKYSGLCQIKVAVYGRSVTYNGILSAAGSRVELDLLGPLFTPILRVKLGPEGFAMDPLHIEGVRGDAVAEAAFGAFSALRDYLSGGLFVSSAPVYGSSWRGQWVDVPSWRLHLSDDGLRVETIESRESADLKLGLADFSAEKGRLIPARLNVQGKGFSVAIQFQKVNVDFADRPPRR